jgi:hypothetical protein
MRLALDWGMLWRPVAVASTAVTLLACAMPPPGEPLPNGKLQGAVCGGPGICVIKISDLKGTGCPFSFDGRDPAVHELKVSLTHGTVRIRWVLDATVSGYRFAAGDDFKVKQGEASGQFSDPQVLGDKAFEVTDAVTDSKLHEYTLLLHSTTPGDDCLHQAYIKNP